MLGAEADAKSARRCGARVAVATVSCTALAYAAARAAFALGLSGLATGLHAAVLTVLAVNFSTDSSSSRGRNLIAEARGLELLFIPVALFVGQLVAQLHSAHDSSPAWPAASSAPADAAISAIHLAEGAIVAAAAAALPLHLLFPSHYNTSRPAQRHPAAINVDSDAAQDAISPAPNSAIGRLAVALAFAVSAIAGSFVRAQVRAAWAAAPATEQPDGVLADASGDFTGGLAAFYFSLACLYAAKAAGAAAADQPGDHTSFAAAAMTAAVKLARRPAAWVHVAAGAASVIVCGALAAAAVRGSGLLGEYAVAAGMVVAGVAGGWSGAAVAGIVGLVANVGWARRAGAANLGGHYATDVVQALHVHALVFVAILLLLASGPPPPVTKEHEEKQGDGKVVLEVPSRSVVVNTADLEPPVPPAPLSRDQYAIRLVKEFSKANLDSGESSSTLLRAAEDVAYLLQSERGQLNLTLQNVDLRVLVNVMLESTRERFLAKGVEFVYVSLPPGGIVGAFDPSALRKVWTSVVQVCLKIADTGTKARCHIRHEGGTDSPGLRITVRVESAQFQKSQLTSTPYALDPDLSAEVPTTGLELAVADAFVKLMSGRIEHKVEGRSVQMELFVPVAAAAEPMDIEESPSTSEDEGLMALRSPPSRRSTISILNTSESPRRLEVSPLDVCRRSSNGSKAAADNSTGQRQQDGRSSHFSSSELVRPSTASVLLIDESAVSRQLVAKMLKVLSTTITVHDAKDGEEAMVLFNTVHCDVILIDYAACQFKGEDMLSKCKYQWACPIVVVIANPLRPEESLNLEQRGATGFVSRPITKSVLVHVIKTWAPRPSEPKPPTRTGEHDPTKETTTPESHGVVAPPSQPVHGLTTALAPPASTTLPTRHRSSPASAPHRQHTAAATTAASAARQYSARTRSAAATGVHGRSSSASGGSGTAAVLVVDHDATNRAATRRLVETCGVGYEVVEVADGMDAVRHCAGRAFGMVFVDWGLRGTIQGRETAIRIRANNADLPVFVLTDDAAGTEASGDLRSSITGVLFKPLSRRTVLELCIKYAVAVPAAGYRSGGSGGGRAGHPAASLPRNFHRSAWSGGGVAVMRTNSAATTPPVGGSPLAAGSAQLGAGAGVAGAGRPVSKFSFLEPGWSPSSPRSSVAGSRTGFSSNGTLRPTATIATTATTAVGNDGIALRARPPVVIVLTSPAGRQSAVADLLHLMSVEVIEGSDFVALVETCAASKTTPRAVFIEVPRESTQFTFAVDWSRQQDPPCPVIALPESASNGDVPTKPTNPVPLLPTSLLVWESAKRESRESRRSSRHRESSPTPSTSSPPSPIGPRQLLPPPTPSPFLTEWHEVVTKESLRELLERVLVVPACNN
ncbi:hypothetical protein DFJ73DRAFT_924616 [Zopfochytrium polystomum]|nr:hypothetical protein DFJ73DRAFT_924616 [Zopfochytrium polystomum]